MDEQRVMQIINDIEKKIPVNKWRINDVDVWPIYRNITAFKLFNSNIKSIPIEKINNNKNFLNGKLPNLSDLLEKRQEAEILILSDAVYRVEIDSVWYNRLSDPFYETVKKLGYRATNLDFSEQGVEKFPVIEETYSIRNQLNEIQNSPVLSDLHLDLPFFEEVHCNFLALTTNEDIVPKKEDLIWIASFVLKMKNVFKEILIRNKTKVVFIANYYQKMSYALILAARELNITTIDIQHGNQLNLYYHKWTNAPINGYNTLPSVFWNWSETDATPILEWTKLVNFHHSIIGGNLWIELWENNNNPIVQKYDKKTEMIMGHDEIKILITLQPSYGLIGWDSNIPEWLAEAIEKSPDYWKFYIRYHNQMHDTYKSEKDLCEKKLSHLVKSGKVETEKSTNLPLPSLLRKIDVHLTAYSTCVIEAKEFNVPSVTLHERAEIFFKQEIEDGWVLEAKNTVEVLNCIEKQLNFSGKTTKCNSGSHIILNDILKMLNNHTFSSAQSNLTTLLEIYYGDGLYEKVIESYEETNSMMNSIIAAKAYNQLGKNDLAIECLSNYLMKAKNSNCYKESIENILLSIELFLDAKDEQKIDLWIQYIIKYFKFNDSFVGVIFKRLFELEGHEVIIKLEYEGKFNMDVLFYKGRTLLKIGRGIEGVILLQKFLTIYNSGDFERQTLTSKENFLASAYFYVGEYFSYTSDIKKAIYYFEKSNEIYKGTNRKVEEILKELKGE